MSRYTVIPRNRSGDLETLARFMAKVLKTDRCWLWTGAKEHYRGRNTMKGNYGRFWLDGKRMKAHRAAWILLVGPLDDDVLVLHRCDNQLCVKPDDLFVGTNADNSRDMVLKGRAKTGTAKLTPLKVRAIRDSSETQVTLAARYDVTQPTISNVINRKLWKNV